MASTTDGSVISAMGQESDRGTLARGRIMLVGKKGAGRMNRRSRCSNTWSFRIDCASDRLPPEVGGASLWAKIT
jgi:hypothetical protein